MIMGSSNEHKNKLARVQDLLRTEFSISAKPLFADYVFAGNGKTVGMEVKWSISDLLDSLQVVGEAGGPRLAVEVKKLLTCSNIAILIIPSLHRRGDGKLFRDDGQVSGWDYASVKGILSDIQLYGCIVDEWDGPIDGRIAQWYYALSQEGHSWIRQLGRPDFAPIDPAYQATVWALCAFKGVGPVAAEKLLAQFSSVAGVVKADVKMLTAVKGIGPKVAQAIYDGLHEEWK